LRLFIALNLPDSIKKYITDYVETIKPIIDGVKWEREEKYHITLKFLENVNPKDVTGIENILKSLTSGFYPFELSIKNFGGFPNLKNPRVLIINMSRNQKLDKMKEHIERSLSVLGFDEDKRKFFPHITIGRVKKKCLLQGPVPVPDELNFVSGNITLVESILNPKGSVYSNLLTINLQIFINQSVC